MAYRIDFKDVAAQLASRVEDVCRHLLPKGVADGPNWMVGDITGEKGQSLKIVLRQVNGCNVGYWKDWATGESGDLLELWSQSRNLQPYEAAKEALDWLGMNPEELRRNAPAVQSVPESKPTSPVLVKKLQVVPETDQYFRRLAGRLKNHEQAQVWLQERGFTAAVERFGLGLSMPYTTDEGHIREFALTFPIVNRDGKFVRKYGYIHIPGVTTGNIGKNGKPRKSWGSGTVLAYHSKAITIETTIAIITEGQKDLWSLDKFLADTPYARNVVLITSSHGTNPPDEWNDPSYWELIDKVYVATDNDIAGDEYAGKVAERIGRETYRVRVPHSYNQKGEQSGTDLTDFVLANPSLRDFERLLKHAPETMSEALCNNKAVTHVQLKDLNPGDYAYAPIDINGGFDTARRLLHYPVTIHEVKDETKTDEEGNKTTAREERLRTVVMRSDRKILKVIGTNAPQKTAAANMVQRLNDGTIIKEKPTTNAYATWDWMYAEKYIEGSFKPTATEPLVQQIISHLKGSVWLPNSEDYILLAFTVLATYVQEAFEAVPYILANGIAGSGKSQLGMAMAELSCNSNVVGAITAATMSREINNTSGLLVIDDLEGIANSSKSNTQVNDMLQFLKVGYKKATSNRRVTEGQGDKARVVNLNLFGIKFITNTQGVEGILGTRMLTIQTRKMVEGQKMSHRPLPHNETFRLRQQLHAWAFDNVAKLYDRYQTLYAEKTNREDEISAPLRVIASFVETEALKTDLEAALGKQDRYRHDDNDPISVLMEAVDNLIQRGFYTPTVQHIVMEMRTLVEDGFGQDMSNEIPEWSKPEWVSRQLKQNDLVDQHAPAKRVRLYGKNLRTVVIARQKIDSVVVPFQANGGVVQKQESRAFCQGCEACPYAGHGCDFMSARLKVVNS